MDVRIKPSNISGNIDAISSKSNAHRVFICAALSNRPTKVTLDTTNDDIDTTLNCLEQMGAKIERQGTSITIYPIPDTLSTPTINCNESGSTLRFLLPVVAALFEKSDFTGSGRLPERPLSELLEALSNHGVSTSSPKLPFTTKGKLNGGEFILPGNVSSQYVSGILMAAPLTGEDVKITLSSPLESVGYVNMTLDTMRDFNIEISEYDNGYFIKGGQRYLSKDDFKIEGDWSNAAFFLVGGALSQPIIMDNLRKDSSQGDSDIVNIIKSFGGDIDYLNDRLISSPTKLLSTTIDVSEVPDLLPILSILATNANGITRFVNASRLRIKESDRLHAMYRVITSLGGKCEELEDQLIVHGTDGLKGGEVDSFNDHRIAMAATIASTISSGDIIIRNAHAVNKSYPKFFEDFNKLGGDIHVIYNG